MTAAIRGRRLGVSPKPPYRINRGALVVVVALVAAVVLGLGPLNRTEPEPTVSELEIGFFSSRVESNPRDVVSATRLGLALRQHQRETGDIDSLFEADRVLEAALGAIPTYTPGQLAHAQILIDLHRFDEGLALADSVYEAEGNTGALLTVGDAHLALGNYEEAEAIFNELGSEVDSPALDARVGRLAELNGDLTTAIVLMDAAHRQVIADGTGGEQAAWFASRLAGLHLANNEPSQAKVAYESALFALPDYAPAIAGLADVAIADGDYATAIELLERATSLAVDPDWYFTLSELHLLQGSTAEAERYEALGESTVTTFGEIHPRDFALHYADSDNARALTYAEFGLDRTDDIYAHDTMAWVLYHSSRLDEALAHSEQALALGTLDGELLYHHGAILLALGRTADGIEVIDRAMSVGLDPWIEAEAVALLADSGWEQLQLG